ncbi:MAG: 6-carboxytetrahydropterin synthase QueD [Treponema sp.]|nr:6-carboxytetrahydropterin synthase QueD [Treponema sp.]MEE3436080.1 6-carboxytetrahydropterin synthase QueD [Treponema sp.]
MFEVRVEDDFAAAHFLRDYNGKCEALHGHNYKVFVHVRGSALNDGGMLLDFTQLKAALKKVLAALDHTNLNDNPFFDQNPSAERIALYICQNVQAELDAQKKDVRLYSVDVFETDKNRATYYPD